MKKILAVLISGLLVVGMCFGMASCGNENELKIGWTDYAPINYYDKDGNFVGFDTDFAKKVCKDLGYTAKFVEINWDTKMVSLNSKEIDCIWNGMTITSELKDNLLISDSYMENKQVVIVRTADKQKYSTIEDLSKATSIAYESGSAGETVITEQESLKNITQQSMPAQKDTLLEVKTGASDIAIIDFTMAKTMVGEGTDYADLTYCDVGFESEEYGIGFRKGDTELCAKINDLIKKYKEDGTFTALYNQYMV